MKRTRAWWDNDSNVKSGGQWYCEQNIIELYKCREAILDCVVKKAFSTM